MYYSYYIMVIFMLYSVCNDGALSQIEALCSFYKSSSPLQPSRVPEEMLPRTHSLIFYPNEYALNITESESGSVMSDSETPRTIRSMEFSRQEY